MPWDRCEVQVLQHLSGWTRGMQVLPKEAHQLLFDRLLEGKGDASGKVSGPWYRGS